MVRLRLRRVGRKKQPSYRVVAAEKEAPRDGRFLEVVGFYNPRTEPSTINLKENRIFDWLSKGAQPSDSVESLFRQMGTRDRFERFKAGESIEKLMEEYQAVEDGRTKADSAGPAKKSRKAKAAEAAAAAEAEKAAAEKAAAKAKDKEEAEAAKEAAKAEKAKEAEEAPAEEPAADEPAAEEPAAEAEAPAEEVTEEAPADEAEEAPADEAEEAEEE